MARTQTPHRTTQSTRVTVLKDDSRIIIVDISLNIMNLDVDLRRFFNMKSYF